MFAQASRSADPREGVSPSQWSALNRGTHVTVRPAVEADQASITALVKSERLNPNDLDWRRFWVAVQGDQVVGAAQIRCHPDGSREVSSLVVARPNRNQGLASRLLDALLDGAPTDLYLITGRALAGYYQRWGFRSASIARAPRCVRRNYWLGQLVGLVISCMKRRKPRRLAVMHRAGQAARVAYTARH
jgi:N-acetylglutamate synthase-like GNAT family acetyltransferase